METPNLDRMTIQKDVPGLIQALHHEDHQIREKAARSLGEMGDRRAVEPLFFAAWKDPFTVYVENLGEFGEYIYPVQIVGAEALKSLVSRIGARALRSLIVHHKDAGWGSQITHELLLIIGLPAVEPLIAALLNRDEFKRSAAARTLGDIGSRQAVDALINALMDKDDRVRENAASSLGKIGDLRAVEPLIAALHISWKSSWAWGGSCSPTAIALGKLGDSRAVEALAQALQPERIIDVRLSALEALEAIGESGAVKALIPVLQDEAWSVRLRAAEALGRIGDPQALQPLSEMLDRKGEVIVVRRSVEAGIRKIQEKTVHST